MPNSSKGSDLPDTHRDNLPWILTHGLHCETSKTVDPNYVQIGDPDLIDKRRHRAMDGPFGGKLSDYVPFYFTPFSPMFLNINTGHRGIRKRDNDEIAILVSSLHQLLDKGVSFIFTDRHASLDAAQVFTDLERLDQIDWALLQRRDFKRDPDDPGKFERYEAEALVHKHVPVEALLGIFCYNDSTVARLQPHLLERGLAVPIVSKPNWYF